MNTLPAVIPKVRIYKKHRASRTPNKDKIGKIVETHERLWELVELKKSVVINTYINPVLIPASVLINYPYFIVRRYIEDKQLKEYNI